MGESGERLYLVSHGPFTVRSLGTPEGAYEDAMQHLVDHKYYGLDFDEPLSMPHLELHPHDKIFRAQGIHTDTVLMSIYPPKGDSVPMHEQRRPQSQAKKQIFGQGTFFNAVLRESIFVLALDVHYPDFPDAKS